MFKFTEKAPSPDEYNFLKSQVGWKTDSIEVIEEALSRTIYSVCAYNNGQICGFARIIGDKTLFLYIQDVMVDPKFQGKYIGATLMEYVLAEVRRLKLSSPAVRTYLGASKGNEGFYKKFGFVSRAKADLGDGMILIR